MKQHILFVVYFITFVILILSTIHVFSEFSLVAKVGSVINCIGYFVMVYLHFLSIIEMMIKKELAKNEQA